MIKIGKLRKLYKEALKNRSENEREAEEYLAHQQVQAAINADREVVEIYATEIVGSDHDDAKQIDDLLERGLDVVSLTELPNGSVRIGSVVKVDSWGAVYEVESF